MHSELRLAAIVQASYIKNTSKTTLDLLQQEFDTVSSHLHNTTAKIKRNFPLPAKSFFSKVRAYILTCSILLRPPDRSQKLVIASRRCSKTHRILTNQTKPNPNPSTSQVRDEVL